MNIKTEQDVINHLIIPRLTDDLKWSKESFAFEKDRADIVYNDGGRPLMIIEAKSPAIKSEQAKKQALQQGINYGRKQKAKIVIATNGTTFFETWHLKDNAPLKNELGQELDISNWHKYLTFSNLHFFKKSSSLEKRIIDSKQLIKFFDKLNKYGFGFGKTSGIPRVMEIAKIIFIKILADNEKILNDNDWDYLMHCKDDDKKDCLNGLLERIKKSNKEINIPDLNLPEGQSNSLAKLIYELNDFDFNYKHYDVIGGLFEQFLSRSLKGGGTNDLGQYFTPRTIIKKMYELAGYQKGQTVYDPYCGTGGILLSFFSTYSEHNGQDNLEDFGRKYLFGNEISAEISILAKMNMVLAGDGHSNIINCDSLSKTNKLMDKSFDIIATNMPFKPKPPEDTKRDYFKLSADSNHPIAKFIEHCINRCKPRGKIILITSKGFLTDNKMAPFRKRLLENLALAQVYVLHGGLFKPYTNAHSCLLIMENRRPQSQHAIKFCYIDEGFSEQNKYQIQASEILEDENKDFIAKKYINLRKKDRKLKDLVRYISKPVGGEDKEAYWKIGIASWQKGIYLILEDERVNRDDSYKYQVEKGAIVISRIMNQTTKTCGVGLVHQKAEKGLITGEYHQIIPNDPSDLYYLIYYMNTPEFQKQLFELTTGVGGQQRISEDDFLNIPIPNIDDKYKNHCATVIKQLMKLDQKINELQNDMNTQYQEF